jgi:hypothetical protein
MWMLALLGTILLVLGSMLVDTAFDEFEKLKETQWYADQVEQQ